MKKRLILFIEYLNIGQNKFAKTVGLSIGYMSTIKENITIKTVDKICSVYPYLNKHWLLTGEGAMLKEEPQINTTNMYPLVDFEAAAGFGSTGFQLKKEDIKDLYRVSDFQSIDFMIRVKGNSMYPKYSSGDIIACRILRETTFIEWNKPHLIDTTEHGLIVKRLRESKKENHVRAVSDNKDYAPFDIPHNEITGIAVVIGVIRLE